METLARDNIFAFMLDHCSTALLTGKLLILLFWQINIYLKSSHLDSASIQQMLSHTLDENLKEEPGMSHEFADNKLIGIGGKKH